MVEMMVHVFMLVIHLGITKSPIRRPWHLELFLDGPSGSLLQGLCLIIPAADASVLSQWKELLSARDLAKVVRMRHESVIAYSTCTSTTTLVRRFGSTDRPSR